MEIVSISKIEDYKRYISGYIPDNVYVVIDENLTDYHNYFDSYNCFKLRAIESNKTLQTVEKIYDWLLTNGAQRSSLLIGVGGGITTDITGYVAATYLRGISCILIPTTLLAMCDAAIGGKNGVNLNRYKNLVGTIREPHKILINTLFLKTLPTPEFKEGIAEMLKNFLIADEKLYNEAVDFFATLNSENIANSQSDLQFFIEKCQEIKLKIVEEDLLENGKRRVLNFGHTFAHAIEYMAAQSTVNKTILHGFAVAVGMIEAIRLSAKRGLCTNEFAQKICDDFKRIGLPTSLKDLGLKANKELIYNAIAKDKKIEGEKIHFIFIQKAGEAIEIAVTLNEIIDISN